MDKVVYLTFDDGPSENTLKILEILDLYGIKATFFVVGRDSKFHENIYQQIAAGGHAIGNHTYSHDYSRIYSSIDAFKQDFYALENLLVRIIGYKPDIFRFPGGSNNQINLRTGSRSLMPRLAEEMLTAGYQFFDWNVDSRDAAEYLQASDIIINSVIKGATTKDQAIILMHDAPVKTTTVKALPEIIVGLSHRGFRFKYLTKESFPYHHHQINVQQKLVPAVQPWFGWDAPINNSPGSRSTEQLAAIIRACNVATAARYQPNQQGKNETYCNIFVWDVTRALGAEIPHWVLKSDLATPAEPDLTYSNAAETTSNMVFDWLTTHGTQHGWQPATALKALDYANSGRPAVAVWKNPGGAGHIAVVRPGTFDPEKGVPIAQAGAVNFDHLFLADGFGHASEYVLYFVHE